MRSATLADMILTWSGHDDGQQQHSRRSDGIHVNMCHRVSKHCAVRTQDERTTVGRSIVGVHTTLDVSRGSALAYLLSGTLPMRRKACTNRSGTLGADKALQARRTWNWKRSDVS